MKRHHSLPQDGSSEGLAEWIRTKSVGQQTHTEKQMYTEDDIAVLATKSAKSSIEIDKLEEIKTEFMDSLNNGQASEDDETFSIPTTVGIKSLKEKRHEAGIEIERGYKEINTPIYCIPDPDNNRMCYFDTGGNLYDDHTVDMDSNQREKYSSPLFQDGQKVPLASETIEDQIEEKEKTKSDNGNKSEGGTGDSSGDEEKSELEEKQEDIFEDSNFDATESDVDEEIVAKEEEEDKNKPY